MFGHSTEHLQIENAITLCCSPVQSVECVLRTRLLEPLLPTVGSEIHSFGVVTPSVTRALLIHEATQQRPPQPPTTTSNEQRPTASNNLHRNPHLRRRPAKKFR